MRPATFPIYFTHRINIKNSYCLHHCRHPDACHRHRRRAPRFALQSKRQYQPSQRLYLSRHVATGTKPAIQSGFDYTHVSGFYAGAWSSSISWLSDAYTQSAQLNAGTANYGANNAGLELDTYFGFYSYSLGDTFAVPDTNGTDYVDLSASYPLADTGITLGAHWGKQTYKGSSAKYITYLVGTQPSYSDYKLSVSKDVSGYVFGLAYSKTNAATGPGTYYNVLGTDTGKGTAVLSVSRTF